MRDTFAWSFPIGRMFGVTIHVHVIMPLVMIGLISREAVRRDAPIGSWQDANWLMILLFVSVLLHELGHCFATRQVGGECDEVVLWPLGGLTVGRLPHSPLAHFVAAFGGPLVNILLCAISGLVLIFLLDYVPPLNPLWHPYRFANQSPAVHLWSWDHARDTTDDVVVIVLARVFWINWMLLLSNMVLAAHPFDGARLLQAALWPRFGYYQATQMAIFCGLVVLMMVALFSIVFSEPLIAFLAAFIFVASSRELMELEMRYRQRITQEEEYQTPKGTGLEQDAAGHGTYVKDKRTSSATHIEQHSRTEPGFTEEARGERKGLLAGIELSLELKFGAAGLVCVQEIRHITDLQLLQTILRAIKTTSTIEELRRLWS